MNNFEVSLCKEMCFICGKEIDGPIIVNSILTEKAAQEVKQLHNKCIGYSDEICPECKKLSEQGLIVLEIDPSKSKSDSWDDGIYIPYRTGKIWVIKSDCELAQNMKDFIINKFGCKFIFIDQEAAKQLGFYE